MRSFYALLLLLLISLSAQSQRFTGELIGGMAGTQVSGDQLSGFDKGGILTGAGVKMKLGTKSDLGFRILYFQKGSRKPSDLENGDPSYYLLRLNYLEVPILYRNKIYKKFFVEAGPSIGFLVGSSEQDQDGELALRTEFNDLDFSAALGLGYSLSPKADFTFGYYQSLIPVRPHSGNAQYRLNQGQYNSSITFTLTYNLIPRGE
jgi:hypothetical protein